MYLQITEVLMACEGKSKTGTNYYHVKLSNGDYAFIWRPQIVKVGSYISSEPQGTEVYPPNEEGGPELSDLAWNCCAEDLIEYGDPAGLEMERLAGWDNQN